MMLAGEITIHQTFSARHRSVHETFRRCHYLMQMTTEKDHLPKQSVAVFVPDAGQPKEGAGAVSRPLSANAFWAMHCIH